MKPIPIPFRRSRRAGNFPLPWAFFPLAAVLFAAMLPAALAAQKQPAPRPNPKAFVGSWTATFKGAPFMTIRFAMKDGKLSGVMSNGQMTVDSNGNITAVTVRPGEKPVKIQKVEHDVIYMRHAAKKDPVRFAFRLNDKTHAQLEILNTPPLGIAPLKPIPLVKQTKKH
jgi:hypothetical protein